MCRKNSTHVDGGLSEGSSVRRPGSEDPNWHELKFVSADIAVKYLLSFDIAI